MWNSHRGFKKTVLVLEISLDLTKSFLNFLSRDVQAIWFWAIALDLTKSILAYLSRYVQAIGNFTMQTFKSYQMMYCTWCPRKLITWLLHHANIYNFIGLSRFLGL